MELLFGSEHISNIALPQGRKPRVTMQELLRQDEDESSLQRTSGWPSFSVFTQLGRIDREFILLAEGFLEFLANAALIWMEERLSVY